MEILMSGTAAIVAIVFVIAIPFLFRRVVPTNEVHIVQSRKKTKSYGKDTGNGNVYYQIPSWIPYFGITKVMLPVSVFAVNLHGYEAYDTGRLPFVVDVTAFFRIVDSNIAASRVSSFKELHEQLQSIIQGAVRVILARYDIEAIMQGRSQFGAEFTKEVDEQLKNWGVSTVTMIELLDLRDSRESAVIKNIMEKKKSHIEMESRTEVANNKRTAKIAEIEADKMVALETQKANQEVGLRTVENQRQVNIASQEAAQAIKEQERLTKEKEMSIKKVEDVRTAEIRKDVFLVDTARDKEAAIIAAEGQKARTTITAEGVLEAKKKESEGIKLEGEAHADAKKAMELAPVQAQIALSKEIGQNKSYQEYLITIRQIEAQQAIGMEQAKALDKADIKVIANTGSPAQGVSSVMDLFSSKGGTEIGAMLEGLAQTDKGQELIKKVLK